MSPRVHRVLCLLVVALGLSRPLVWLGGGRVVQAGLVQFLCSPLPMVFDRDGFFSAHSIEVRRGEGTLKLRLDGAALRRVRGPLNRRSLLTHTLSYGRDLPAELRDPVSRWLLCEPGVLLRELGLEPGQSAAFVSELVATGERTRLEQPCP